MSKVEYYQIENDDGKMGIQELIGEEFGKVIIAPEYDFIGTFGDGAFSVQIDDKIGFVDLQNKPLFPFVNNNDIECFKDFSEGLAGFRKNELYGFIDKRGKEIIPPKYSFVEDFHNGFAIVRIDDSKGDKYGAIDKNGKTVIPLHYEYLTSFEHGYTIFGDRNYSSFGLLDATGSVILDQQYCSMDFQESNLDIIKEQKNGDLQKGFFDYKTKKVTWTDELEEQNKMRKKIAYFETQATALVQDIYKDKCVCRYPRFVKIIDGLSSLEFQSPDSERLFSIVTKQLDDKSTDEVTKYVCPKCGSTYLVDFKEFNAFHSTVSFTAQLTEDLEQTGADVTEPIPILFGFQYLESNAPPNFNVKQAEPDELIQYLKEKK